MGKLGRWAVAGMLWLFVLGVLNRVLNDPGAPNLIGSFLNALSGLVSNTINS